MEFEYIKSKLRELQELDNQLLTFGSDSHQYLSKQIPEIEITKFEDEFNIQIPENFRSFLQRIGYGAGPYYGIWNFEEIRQELSINIEALTEDGIDVNPSKNFPFTKSDLEMLEVRFMNNEKDDGANIPILKGTYPIEGSIPICHHGCTSWTYLALNGEFKGTVWDVNCLVGIDGMWIPSTWTPQVITFEKWYEKWLLESIEKAQHFPIATDKPKPSQSLLSKMMGKVLKSTQ